ncbi:response regulator [Paenibacillus allorhizosphaerae]|uniref:HTH-type transcriptional activator RhaR n=1 Tax=Paenibacillus allorhizosphaerae TaxID=2849866 RepID=A0ABN7TWB0_9BACL|nr:response regulator [Paenibacillus allorhizosphaerae]CAG7654504.1 HTH-type transcriptional activator RhaR [Paenibacillus allorhizosphaerae]
MARLLIVDDEAHVVERLAGLVPWDSIRVTKVYKAYSAFEALELLEEHPIELVITDIRMPGMSGLELAAEIQRKWHKTRCILLSGHADFAYAQEAIVRGTANYLLKPVTDEELLQTAQEVLRKLEEEWAQIISQERIERTLRENLPQLRGQLLAELLQGRRYSREGLANKLKLLQAPDLMDSTFAMLLIRLEDPFPGYDAQSIALVEYGIGNMAEELFAQDFQLWQGKDAHDNVIFLVKCIVEAAEAERSERLERTASQLQHAIRTYLKGQVSILIGGWGAFPADLTTVYDRTLTALRQRVGREQELILAVGGSNDLPGKLPLLHSVYQLPTLAQLLEAGHWGKLEERIDAIFAELKGMGAESEEYLLEVFLAISSAITQTAHKSGILLSSLIGTDYDRLLQGTPFRTWKQLHDWTQEVFGRFRSRSEAETKDSRIGLIRQVREFIEESLSEDVSLQAIADRVYLHPVYVSKIYKLETGENISDYVYRLRMEKAAQLLLNSQEKIYEIAAKLGYQRAHSFINVFKKHTGLTPQEYRDQHLPS